jgi:MoxR-like ATPase
VTTSPGDATPAEAKERLEQALFEIRRVIAGQDAMLERVLVCLLAQGHLLIEGVPGLAKTLTIKTTAGVLGGSFARIQFTPDLVPSDLVGTRIYRGGEGVFDTELGPVFCNFLLADEINRAPAKVQSALLEVMQERQVTIGHDTFPVPDPFLVLATQNPHEHAGTYPLPESQLDRFLLRLNVGYPDADVERELLLGGGTQEELSELRPVATVADVRRLQQSAAAVRVAREVADYVLAIVAATRASPLVSLGVSPRGAIALLGVAKARALLRGRDYVEPDDVKELCVPCLAHRIALAGRGAGGEVERLAAERAIRELVEQVPVPE